MMQAPYKSTLLQGQSLAAIILATVILLFVYVIIFVFISDSTGPEVLQTNVRCEVTLEEDGLFAICDKDSPNFKIAGSKQLSKISNYILTNGELPVYTNCETKRWRFPNKTATICENES